MPGLPRLAMRSRLLEPNFRVARDPGTIPGERFESTKARAEAADVVQNERPLSYGLRLRRKTVILDPSCHKLRRP